MKRILSKVLCVEFGVFMLVAPLIVVMLITIIFGLVGGISHETLAPLMMAIGSVSFIGIIILGVVVLKYIFKGEDNV